MRGHKNDAFLRLSHFLPSCFLLALRGFIRSIDGIRTGYKIILVYLVHNLCDGTQDILDFLPHAHYNNGSFASDSDANELDRQRR